MLQRFLTTQLPVDLGKKSWLLPYTSGANRNRVLGRYGLASSSLRKHPFLLALRRWGRFARKVPSGEERGETDVFAG